MTSGKYICTVYTDKQTNMKKGSKAPVILHLACLNVFFEYHNVIKQCVFRTENEKEKESERGREMSSE